MDARKVYRRLVGALLPELCPRCACTTAAGFCRACRRDFHRVDSPCTRCGLPQPVAHCPRTLLEWHVDRVLVPYAYSRPLSTCVQDMKFGRRRSLARAFGLLLAEHARRRSERIDFLVPVPLHASRLRARRFNQADEIARTVAREIARPVIASGVSRAVATEAQTALKPMARIENLRGAFRAQMSIAGARIAIVDDVMTTGATVNSLARELRARGASQLEVWVVARAVAQDQLRNR